VGQIMLSSKLSILRLRRFERECSDGSDEASDPLTNGNRLKFFQETDAKSEAMSALP
jgi:hypothetical protein